MMYRKQYTLKSVHNFTINFNTMSPYENLTPEHLNTRTPQENLSPEQKKSWSTVLKFAVELIKLIIASFLGGSASTLIS